MTQKLASPTFLKQLTGEDDPQRQYDTLCELGMNKITLKHGMVRVYYEHLIDFMSRPPKDYDPTALYRHWDKNGELLYVGISTNPFKRTSEHRQARAKHMFMQVRKITMEWFMTRREALEAEKDAIQNEKPMLNKDFNK